MPVEIRELIIRTTLVNNSKGAKGHLLPIENEGDDAIISACVEQVLKILERKRER